MFIKTIDEVMHRVPSCFGWSQSVHKDWNSHL